jgi:amino acid permease
MSILQMVQAKLQKSTGDVERDVEHTHGDDVTVVSMQSVPSSSSAINRGNGMSVFAGAALILADCMGTGILALPNDIRVVLDDKIGILFVLFNLPINLYAGYILSETAQFVEDGHTPGKDNDLELTEVASLDFDYDEESDEDEDDAENQQDKATKLGDPTSFTDLQQSIPGEGAPAKSRTGHVLLSQNENGKSGARPVPQSTSDFIGLTGALFGNLSRMKLAVLLVYYVNLFLVLGNYILVMSHAARAFVGEEFVCTLQAGIGSSVFMYAVAQLNTMAKLGRTATYVSLASLLIVIYQCIHAVDENQQPPPESEMEPSIFRKMAALSSIAFAVGSQKLFLNVRHEMSDPKKAPLALAIALVVFGVAYIGVGQLAGPVPPSFLFDAIPYGSGARRITALFLWIHVAVSYAINSQALCASMERMAFCEMQNVCCCLERFRSPSAAPVPSRIRWMFLTLVTSVSAFIVANIVPFFQDLIALIGAVTSIPLTLLIPAILYRKTRGVPILCRSRPLRKRNKRRKSCRQRNITSFCLLLFSIAFLIVGLMGAISTIEVDWANHAPPFSCDG